MGLKSLSRLCVCAAWLCPAVALAFTIEPRPSESAEAERLKSIALLAPGLRDPDLAKVRKAVDGIGKAGGPGAVERLWDLYGAGDGPRRRLALEGLGRMRLRANVDRFFDVTLTEPVAAVRAAAADALALVAGRDAAAGGYAKILSDPRKYTALGRMRLCAALGRVGGPRAGPPLAEMLQDRDLAVAGTACEALGAAGDLAQAPALIQALRKKNPDLARCAGEALTQLTGQKYGQDLVRWEQWQEDFLKGRIKAPPEPDPLPAGVGAVLAPEAFNPYAVPLNESAVDCLVLFATTDSMGRWWFEVHDALAAVLTEMARRTASFRLGSVRFRADAPDKTLSYLTETHPLTWDIAAARKSLRDVTFGPGLFGLGLGLQVALTAQPWRQRARKVVVVVADEVPPTDEWLAALMLARDACGMDRILCQVIYVRTERGIENRAPLMQLAELAGGRFYDFEFSQRRLTDASLAKSDPRRGEQPLETLEKWLMPRVRAKP